MKNFKTLTRNPNRHTEYGSRLLTDSFHKNGYSEPMVAAANGTILSGNLRAELAADIFKVDPLIVSSDGTRPVVHIRTDIPNEDDPISQRLILASNRVQEVDYAPDAEILATMLAGLQADGEIKGSGYTENDIQELLGGVQDIETQIETLRPKTMSRVLVSIPLDSALEAKPMLDRLRALPGIEVDDGSN